ncbi:hypothetical protein CO057_02060 [Candidatus Uhrbacteria bacterium CG_4_9_14_0_2_um_filter_41_50]|uniref:Uncharacterized protein n=1 Tax=Candidatus Uhrbacteria bacterium CG_4_9_14_0_2_um_filter_41_50 TaxID=1975031 RepID=A0A2M8EPE5_9BACT|nr:MAG: hypothetical protein COZ45_04105 [Candidatus Uhrbacteria bacterium CG_4_10_14_3_um_filter_41_21]PJB84244.1 MAG: hypothetical protein CO086_04530 [Candidatus Uhrbacteria bacterium CG_4_9_14_0_8_um_filter_41_16]PJC24571.1 MAG: hypothetical protein CO057_02060 [Candidatus Uhrbacteria bacterium CG_4_9_14_0_2_um_filter_41_50]
MFIWEQDGLKGSKAYNTILNRAVPLVLENKERTDGLRSLQRLNVEDEAAPMRELLAVHGDLHPLADASGRIVLSLVGVDAFAAPFA